MFILEDKKELLFFLVQSRVFLDSLSNQDIEYLYKLFKHLNKIRNKNAWLGTIEYLFTKGK